VWAAASTFQVHYHLFFCSSTWQPARKQ
jgi:hypothetical protein